PPAKLAPITKQLEGTWTAAVTTAGGEIRLVLKLSNQPDGTAKGSLVNLTEGEVEVPISKLVQDGPKATLEIKIIGGTFAGTLNADASEFVGIYSQNQGNAPVTFKRAAQ